MSKRSSLFTVPAAAPKALPAAGATRGRTAKMDALVHAVSTSPRFSFENAAAAVREAMARGKASS